MPPDDLEDMMERVVSSVGDGEQIESAVIKKEDLKEKEMGLTSETHPHAKKITPNGVVDKTISIDDLTE